MTHTRLHRSLFLLLPFIMLMGFSGCEIEDILPWKNDNGNGDDNGNGHAVLTDQDGNEYNTTEIGDQLWMAENLRTTAYRDGTPIEYMPEEEDWKDATSGAYSIYAHQPRQWGDHIEEIGSEEEMVAAYGKLYNGFTVDDPRGLCPQGWRLPTAKDFEELITFIEDEPYTATTGNALKSKRQVDHPDQDYATETHPRWDAHNENRGTDEFGFSALPAGRRGNLGSYTNAGERTYFWTSTDDGNIGVYQYSVGLSFGHVVSQSSSRIMGYSVRCIKKD